jgi:hypothetical protein
MRIQIPLKTTMLFCATLLLCSVNAIAQSSKLPVAQNTARQEFDALDGYLNEKVTQMGEDGLMLTSRGYKADGGYYTFRYSLINKSLEEGSEILLPVEQSISSTALQFVSPTHFHQFIYSKFGFAIHSIPRKGVSKPVEVTGEFPFKGLVQQFTVLNNQLIVAVKSKTGPVLLLIDWRTGQLATVNVSIPLGVKPKAVKILNLQECTNIGEVSLIYGVAKTKTGPKQWFVHFNSKGDELSTVEISPGPSVRFIEITVSAISNSKFIFSGTYTRNLTKKMAKSAQGFFFAESDAFKLKYVKYNNFLDLKNFVEFLPKKTQSSIERKKERAEDDGKELAFNYLMTIHPIVATADGFFLVGEAYYPAYHTETVYVNGKPQTRRVFDGYQYTHAIVVKFDANGERKMDQCIGMGLLDLPQYVIKNISLNIEVPNQITLSYATSKYLVSKTFNNTGVEISKAQSEMMSTGDEDEKIRNSSATLRHWYGPYFVAYGFQTIKKSGAGKRRVFYINKLQM